MEIEQKTDRTHRIIVTVVLAPVAALAGAFCGGFVATRVFATTNMGWDQLADALGGMMLGGLFGLVIAIGCGFVLRVRGLLAVLATMLLLGVGAVIALRTTSPRIAEPGPRPEPPPAFEPALTFTLFAHDPQTWQGTALAPEAWRRFEVRSENWSAYSETHPGPGAAGRICAVSFRPPVGEPSLDELQRVVDAVLPLTGELSQSCPADEGPVVHLSWSIDGRRTAADVAPTCVERNARLGRLVEQLRRLQTSLDWTCEQSTP